MTNWGYGKRLLVRVAEGGDVMGEGAAIGLLEEVRGMMREKENTSIEITQPLLLHTTTNHFHQRNSVRRRKRGESHGWDKEKEERNSGNTILEIQLKIETPPSPIFAKGLSLSYASVIINCQIA